MIFCNKTMNISQIKNYTCINFIDFANLRLSFIVLLKIKLWCNVWHKLDCALVSNINFIKIDIFCANQHKVPFRIILESHIWYLFVDKLIKSFTTQFEHSNIIVLYSLSHWLVNLYCISWLFSGVLSTV